MTLSPIECWFELGSHYSYPAVMRIEAMARVAGRPLVWRPMLLGPIFKALGWQGSPFLQQPLKAAYAWRDLERLCAKHGLAWQQPTVFPRRALLPMRVAYAAAEQPWMGAYCRRVMQMNFAEDREIDNPDAVAEALVDVGEAATPWLDLAATEAVKSGLRAQTGQALALGHFGAPTFRVGGEMFWGHDRLVDALAWPG